jgi:hypothetical protein
MDFGLHRATNEKYQRKLPSIFLRDGALEWNDKDLQRPQQRCRLTYKVVRVDPRANFAIQRKVECIGAAW